MGLFSWLRRETRSGLGNPDEWMFDAFGGAPTSSGARVTVSKVLGLSPVWSAVSIIAEQVGQLPFKVYRDIDEGERAEARNHRAWWMLHDKPNSSTPADRFWSTVTCHLLLWGNAYLQKTYNERAEVDELWLLEPGHVTVEWHPDVGTKTFIYDPPQGRRRRFSENDVVHLFGLSVDGVVGESVVSACKGAFGTHIARDEFEGGFYGRGAVMSGLIEAPERLSDDAVKHLKESASVIYGGFDKAHGIGVFEEGAVFKPLSSPLKDLEFVASKQLTATEIASMFRLPPNYLGASSGGSLTYSTVESNQTQFALNAIAPWTNVIAKAISTDVNIFPQINTFNAEFVLEAMLRGDAKSRAEYYQIMKAMGAMTVDEIRRKENMAPLPESEQKKLAPAVPLELPPTDGNGAVPTQEPVEAN